MNNQTINRLIRQRKTFYRPFYGDDIKNINLLLSKYGLRVDDTIDAPTITTYVVNLDVTTNINAILRLEKNFMVAVNDNNVRVYVDGNKLCIEKKGADNTILIDDLYRGLSEDKLNIMVGMDNRGKKIICNLANAPHMLVAGTTGSGKSVFLNSCILSLIMAHPKDVEIIGIDPKGNEFNIYEPLSTFRFVKDAYTAIQVLSELCDEMDRRYDLLARARCRDIDEYNKESGYMKRKVVVIDELADLMHMGGKDVEKSIVRLAQKARACGIHLILGTQRPTADVVTGLIKANIPTRICFAVKSQIDSRIVLDQKGGEKLNGKGDMLFQSNGSLDVMRVQGVYFSSKEAKNMTMYAYYAQRGIDPATKIGA